MSRRKDQDLSAASYDDSEYRDKDRKHKKDWKKGREGGAAADYDELEGHEKRKDRKRQQPDQMFVSAVGEKESKRRSSKQH